VKEVWINLKSTAMAVITVATVIAGIYLIPIILTVLVGVVAFIFYKLMNTEVD